MIQLSLDSINGHDVYYVMLSLGEVIFLKPTKEFTTLFLLKKRLPLAGVKPISLS